MILILISTKSCCSLEWPVKAAINVFIRTTWISNEKVVYNNIVNVHCYRNIYPNLNFRPRRNAETNKRKTPSKPVLPKVSSAEQRSVYLVYTGLLALNSERIENIFEVILFHAFLHSKAWMLYMYQEVINKV